jgi:hypothetical protein
MTQLSCPHRHTCSSWGDGIRTAVPIMIFFTVVGLRSAISAPADRRGAWLFGVLIGRPRSEHLTGTRIWVTPCTLIVGLGTALLLHAFSPDSMKSARTVMGQLLIAVGLPLLLSDILLFPVLTIPFTHLHKSSVNDLPLAVICYFVFFPIFISLIVQTESAIEASALRLFTTLLFFTAAHLLTRPLARRSVHRARSISRLSYLNPENPC